MMTRLGSSTGRGLCHAAPPYAAGRIGLSRAPSAQETAAGGWPELLEPGQGVLHALPGGLRPGATRSQ